MPKLTRHYAHWPEGLPHALEVPEHSLYNGLAANAGKLPDSAAIDYYGRQISYSELHQAVRGLAGYLQQCLGVMDGDRVLLMMQNCPQFVIAYYAVQRANAVVVAINPMSSAEETAYYVDNCGARVAIVMQDMLPKIRPLLANQRLTACIVGAYSELAGAPEDVPFMEIPEFVLVPRQRPLTDAEHEFARASAAAISPAAASKTGSDLALIAYTSGTTGKPKGAMLSHRALTLAAVQRSLWLDDGTRNSDLLTLPMCHIAGMSAMNQAIFQGRTIVLLARWDTNAVPALIERHHVGRWAAVAPMLIDLLTSPSLRRHNLSSLTRLYVGATATPVALARQIHECLGVTLIECYGMTETCGSTHINPPLKARTGSVGIPQIEVDARVIEVSSDAELDCYQPGEIVINCPTQFVGYWNHPDASRAAFVEIEGRPFVRTGDIGYYDEDGYFYITDRLKRMINASGLKVWPSEVEACLSAHPAVQEVCVISAYDPYRGETVKAMIVRRPCADANLSSEDLIEWARAHMAAYKIPRLVEFVESLPKTHSGKVLWRALQEKQNQDDRDRRQAAQQ
ncbi:AMP-binding protein [Herminiimonas sp. CN]|uniref:AMP-binding protein n=1 Tax=Herminiimonas sp. CN TaxID=1349818 RepID=UPI0004742AA2|nr:AMP-binding protein [Herminiimonas sp. CN]